MPQQRLRAPLTLAARRLTADQQRPSSARRLSRRHLLAGLAAIAALGLAACGGSDHSMTGMDSTHSMTGGNATSGGMAGMGTNGDGLAAAVQGYALTVIQPPAGEMAMPVRVTVSKAGAPVTRFTREQTKLMHLYLIRSDLTGFQHVHPELDAHGTWSTPPLRVAPGSYRLYTQVIPDGLSDPIVLSAPVTVAGPGADQAQALPPTTGTGSSDGYTVTVHGAVKAGAASQLSLAITRAGKPVTDLQPYLDTYAHVTAIHAGDLAFAHLHPEQDVSAGPVPAALTLHAELPRPGVHRLFVQFQTGGTLHTVPVTVTAS